MIRNFLVKNYLFHRTVLPILFPLHITSIRQSGIVVKRFEPVCRISENEGVLHQDKRST